MGPKISHVVPTVSHNLAARLQERAVNKQNNRPEKILSMFEHAKSFFGHENQAYLQKFGTIEVSGDPFHCVDSG